MKDYFKIPIDNRIEAEEFFNKLHSDDLLYHPDDSAHDILLLSPCPSEGGPDAFVNLFSKEEADLLDERMNEIYLVHSDPCEYILDNFIHHKK